MIHLKLHRLSLTKRWAAENSFYYQGRAMAIQGNAAQALLQHSHIWETYGAHTELSARTKYVVYSHSETTVSCTQSFLL